MMGVLLDFCSFSIDGVQSFTERVCTKVKWIVAGALDGINLTDPRQIQPALRAGHERAKKEAAQIKAFWA